jgi:hypothetical protein
MKEYLEELWKIRKLSGCQILKIGPKKLRMGIHPFKKVRIKIVNHKLSLHN